MLVLNLAYGQQGGAKSRPPEKKADDFFDPRNPSHLASLNGAINSILASGASESLKKWASNLRDPNSMDFFWSAISSSGRFPMPWKLTFEDDRALRSAISQVPGFGIEPMSEFTASGSHAILCSLHSSAPRYTFGQSPLADFLRAQSAPHLFVPSGAQNDMLSRIPKDVMDRITGANGYHAQILSIEKGDANTALIVLRVPRANYVKFGGELGLQPTLAPSGSRPPPFELVSIEVKLLKPASQPPAAKSRSLAAKQTVELPHAPPQLDGTYVAPKYVYDQYGELVPRPNYDSDSLMLLDFFLPVASIKNVADKINAGQSPTFDDYLWLAVDGVFTVVQAKALYKAGKFAAVCSELAGTGFKEQLVKNIGLRLAEDPLKQRAALRAAYRYMLGSSEKLAGKSADEILEQVTRHAVEKGARFGTKRAGKALSRAIPGMSDAVLVTNWQLIKSGTFASINLAIGADTFIKLADLYELSTSSSLPPWALEKYPEIADLSPEKQREFAFNSIKRDIASFWSVFEVFGVGMKVVSNAAPKISRAYVNAMRSLANGGDRQQAIAEYAAKLHQEGVAGAEALKIAESTLPSTGLGAERLSRIGAMLSSEKAANLFAKTLEASATAASLGAFYFGQQIVDESMASLNTSLADNESILGKYKGGVALDEKGNPVKGGAQQNAYSAFSGTYESQSEGATISLPILVAAGNLFAIHTDNDGRLSPETVGYFNASGLTVGRYNNYVMAAGILGVQEEEDFSTIRNALIERYNGDALTSFIRRFDGKPAELCVALDGTAQRWLNSPGAMEADLAGNPAAEFIMGRWRERVLTMRDEYSDQKAGRESIRANPRMAAAIAELARFALQGYVPVGVLRAGAIQTLPGPISDASLRNGAQTDFARAGFSGQVAATRRLPVSVTYSRDKKTGEVSTEVAYAGLSYEDATQVAASFIASLGRSVAYSSHGMTAPAILNGSAVVSGIIFGAGAASLVIMFKGRVKDTKNLRILAENSMPIKKGVVNLLYEQSVAGVLPKVRAQNASELGKISPANLVGKEDVFMTKTVATPKLTGDALRLQLYNSLREIEIKINGPQKISGQNGFRFSDSKIFELVGDFNSPPENLASLVNNEATSQLREFAARHNIKLSDGRSVGILKKSDIFGEPRTEVVARPDYREAIGKKLDAVQAEVRKRAAVAASEGRLSSAHFTLNIDVRAAFAKANGNAEAAFRIINDEVARQINDFASKSSCVPKNYPGVRQLSGNLNNDRFLTLLKKNIRAARKQKIYLDGSTILDIQSSAFYDVLPYEARTALGSRKNFRILVGRLQKDKGFIRDLEASLKGEEGALARMWGKAPKLARGAIAGAGAAVALYAVMTSASFLAYQIGNELFPPDLSKYEIKDKDVPVVEKKSTNQKLARNMQAMSPLIMPESQKAENMLSALLLGEPLYEYFKTRKPNEAAMCAAFCSYLKGVSDELDGKVSPQYSVIGSPWDFDKKLQATDFTRTGLYGMGSAQVESALLNAPVGSLLTVKFANTRHTDRPVSHVLISIGNGRFAHYIGGKVFVADFKERRLYEAVSGALKTVFSAQSQDGSYTINDFMQTYRIVPKSALYVPNTKALPRGNYLQLNSRDIFGRDANAFEFAKKIARDYGVSFELALVYVSNQNHLSPAEAPFDFRHKNLQATIPIRKIEMPAADFTYPKRSPALVEEIKARDARGGRLGPFDVPVNEMVAFTNVRYLEYLKDAERLRKVANACGYSGVVNSAILALYSEKYQTTNPMALFKPKKIGEEMAVDGLGHGITDLIRRVNSFGDLQVSFSNIDEFFSELATNAPWEKTRKGRSLMWSRIWKNFSAYASPETIAKVKMWLSYSESERHDYAATAVGTDMNAQLIIACHYLEQHRSVFLKNANDCGVALKPEDAELAVAFSHSRGQGGVNFAIFQQNMLAYMLKHDAPAVPERFVIDGEAGNDGSHISLDLFKRVCASRGIASVSTHPDEDGKVKSYSVGEMSPADLKEFFRDFRNTRAFFASTDVQLMPCLSYEFLSANKRHCTKVMRGFLEFYVPKKN